MTDVLLDSPALIEGLSEAAIILDGGHVVAANAAARKLLGDSISGAPLRDVVSHPAALAALEGGTRSGEDIELTGLGGSRRHWLMRSARLPGGASLIRFVDRSEARAAEQMRVDFVANASHELRTPLSTLIGYTETLREAGDEIDPLTRERFLTVVYDEARRMQRVVEDLISLSRIEAEKFTEPTDAIDLRPLIEQAAENARRMAAERNCQIVLSIEPRLPPIAADSGQILQVLENLIANALRYGEPGTTVAVTATDEGSMAHISVQDRGEGIAPEHLPRLTERFYRVDTSRSRALGGTGLGLSIVKHIVERHRGRLKIDSEVGVGTIIHVFLPTKVS